MKVWVCIWLSAFSAWPALFGLDLDVGYLFRLARGQLKLMFKAESIDRMLARKDLDPALRSRLELVQAIRAFAQKDIGLAASKNYTTYVDIGKGPVSWNLTVCPKDRLEPLRWSYPVVGSVPYRGYFDRQKAETARDEYEAKGYDTYLRPVAAYSTLGWFSDPILSTMLRYPEGDLADVIIHELTHATVWIESDVTFNESLASFVGDTGSVLWLQKQYGADAPQVKELQDERADGAVFNQFLHGIAVRLDSLYATERTFDEKMTARTEIFAEAKAQFSHLPLKTDDYARFPQWELNNARLALYRVYQARTDVFARVYAAEGNDLKAAVTVFKRSERQAHPAQWLEDWVAKR